MTVHIKNMIAITIPLDKGRLYRIDAADSSADNKKIKFNVFLIYFSGPDGFKHFPIQ